MLFQFLLLTAMFDVETYRTFSDAIKHEIEPLKRHRKRHKNAIKNAFCLILA